MNAGWFHVGGGFGFALSPFAEVLLPGGRFTLGLGAYTFMLYGGGGFDIDFQPNTPFRFLGQAYVGVAIPIPVFHPMFGFKIAGGPSVLLNAEVALPYPTVSVGGQAGFIVRKFDGGPGFRFMVEPAYVETGYYLPGEGEGGFEIWFTFAAVM